MVMNEENIQKDTSLTIKDFVNHGWILNKNEETHKSNKVSSASNPIKRLEISINNKWEKKSRRQQYNLKPNTNKEFFLILLIVPSIQLEVYENTKTRPWSRLMGLLFFSVPRELLRWLLRLLTYICVRVRYYGALCWSNPKHEWRMYVVRFITEILLVYKSILGVC